MRVREGGERGEHWRLSAESTVHNYFDVTVAKRCCMSIIGVCVLFLLLVFFYTSTKSWRGYIFTSVCLSVCQCVCVCLCVCVCEQNSSRTNAPIWMRFSLNSCFLHWLGP